MRLGYSWCGFEISIETWEPSVGPSLLNVRQGSRQAKEMWKVSHVSTREPALSFFFEAAGRKNKKSLRLFFAMTQRQSRCQLRRSIINIALALARLSSLMIYSPHSHASVDVSSNKARSVLETFRNILSTFDGDPLCCYLFFLSFLLLSQSLINFSIYQNKFLCISNNNTNNRK